jgi:hypothetical protein
MKKLLSVAIVLVICVSSYAQGYYGDRYNRPRGNRAAGQEMFGNARYGMGPGYDTYGLRIYRDGYRSSWGDYSEIAYSVCPPAYYEFHRGVWCGVGAGLCGVTALATGITGIVLCTEANSNTQDGFTEVAQSERNSGIGLIATGVATGIGCGVLTYFCKRHLQNSVALFNQGYGNDHRYRSSLEFGVTPSGHFGISLEF